MQRTRSGIAVDSSGSVLDLEHGISRSIEPMARRPSKSLTSGALCGDGVVQALRAVTKSRHEPFGRRRVGLPVRREQLADLGQRLLRRRLAGQAAAGDAHLMMCSGSS